MYIVHIWPTELAGGRAVPPDVREEPEGALWMFSACFSPEQGFGNSAKCFIWKFGQAELHVRLRKHTISIYFLS